MNEIKCLLWTCAFFLNALIASSKYVDSKLGFWVSYICGIMSMILALL